MKPEKLVDLTKANLSMLKEFKDFAMRGNVIDMAIGVIIGAAFGNIVNSLVKDIIMPPIGKIAGDVDFTNLFIVLGDKHFTTLKAAQEAGAATINYGQFINIVINFLIVSFSVFMMVKFFRRHQREEASKPPPPAPPTKEEILLTEIRDILRDQKNQRATSAP